MKQALHSLSHWLFCKGLHYRIWSILTDLYYIVDLYRQYPHERGDNAGVRYNCKGLYTFTGVYIWQSVTSSIQGLCSA